MKLLSHDYGTPTLPIEHARPILESENHESICVTSGTIFIIPRRHSWMMRGIFVPLLSRVTFRKEKVALQVGCAASRGGPPGTTRSRNRSHVEQSFAGGAET